MDVYLYNFGNPDARLVLHHVSYGTVSPYEQVPDGDYTVSMRAAGAPASAQPVLSTGFQVSSDEAYTVAGMGPAAGLRLQVLRDTFTAPAGQVLVRVIQASLRQHVVSMSLGGLMLARKLDFASMTSYTRVAAGSTTVRVTGNGEDATARLSLPADSIHTLVVLDGPGGLRVHDLTDAAGSQVQPSGGAATGLGGTAPRPAPSPLPWLAAVAAGCVLAGAGVYRYRRQARGPAHAVTPGPRWPTAAGRSCAGRPRRGPGPDRIRRGSAWHCPAVAGQWPGGRGPPPRRPGRPAVPGRRAGPGAAQGPDAPDGPGAPGRPAAAVSWPTATRPVALPVELTVPAIGVRTRLIRLGLTPPGPCRFRPVSPSPAGTTAAPGPGRPARRSSPATSTACPGRRSSTG